MSDVFDFLASLEEEHAQLRKPDSLEKGVLYQSYKFELQIPDGDKIKYRSLVVYIYDDEIKFFVHMPGKYARFTQAQVDDLNKKVEEKMAPKICFYGKMGKANIVEIHKHDQDVNKALLAKVERISKLMADSGQGSPESSPKRGGSDYPDSPAKRFAPGSPKW